MSNNQFDRPSASLTPEEDAQLRSIYDHMCLAARQQRGLPPTQEEHSGPNDYAPNKHVVRGLPAMVDGAHVLVTLAAHEYKVAPYSQESATVLWLCGRQGIRVNFLDDHNGGTLTPKVERVTYIDWGQTSEPVLDPQEVAHYLEEADRLALSL